MFKQLFTSTVIGLLGLSHIYAITPPPERSFTNNIETQRIVDSRGIVGDYNYPIWIHDENLTSNSGWLDIHLRGWFRDWNGDFGDPNSGTWSGGVIHIHSAIVDNVGTKVGLRISGEVIRGAIGIIPSHWRGFVFLGGDLSNTFTGDTEVMDGNVLHLNKNKGATAIRGNIFLSRGGAVRNNLQNLDLLQVITN